MKFNSSDVKDVKKAKEYLNKLTSKECFFEVKEIYKRKSVSNNAYLHVCISLIAIELGYTLEECKTTLKGLCEFMSYRKNGNTFLRSVRDLNNKECAEFTEFIRNKASSIGIYIPTPEEYKEQRFEIDKHIEKHKTLL